MNELKFFITAILHKNKGYISSVTENLLCEYALLKYQFTFPETKNIIEEAEKTFQAQISCPNCGHKHTIHLRICDACGFKYNDEISREPDLQNLISDSENCTADLKRLPKPTLYNIYKDQTHIIFPVSALFSLILAFLVSRSDSEFFAIIFPFVVLFAVLSLFAFRFRKTRKKNDDLLQAALLKRLERNVRTAEKFYGNDSRVQSILSDYDEHKSRFLHNQQVYPRKRLLAYALFTVFLIGITAAVPKKTYNERDIEESSALIENIEHLNGYEFIAKAQNRNIIGRFSEFLSIIPAADTFSINLRSLPSTRPETYFEIRTTIQFNALEAAPASFPEGQRIELNIEILDKTGLPIFESFHLSPVNFAFDYQPAKGKFEMEFLGVYAIKSHAEAQLLVRKTSKLNEDPVFKIYGDFGYW